MVAATTRSRQLRDKTKQKHVSYDASIVLDTDDETDTNSKLNTSKRPTKRRRIEESDLESENDNMEDERESESESESDDEDNYAPNKRAKLQQQRKTRGKQRKQNNPSRKTLVSNIDDVEKYTENPLFEALSNGDYSPTDLAQSWIDDFVTDDLNTKFDALKDFVNFILRCSGCIVQLNRHDVTNTENAKETVNEIQILFARQKYHEFPMMYAPVNNKDWKEFPDNVLSFITQIIVIVGETGVLYEDDGEFIELLLEWISAMSTSNIRALRYVSTLFGLTIQTVFCKLSVNTSKFIDKFTRQLKKENDSLKSLVENKKSSNRQLKRQVDSANERIKVIENNVEMYKNHKKVIDSYISDFFNTLFVHRYRDVAPEIRLKCVNHLGEWMEEYPEMFFESAYLRYLGWLLTDQDSNIRSEVFKVLIKLYKKRSIVNALRQFTTYFKNKLIEIVIYETDFNARSHCLQLLTEIIEKGYLNDDDIIQLTSLIFVDDEDIIYPFQGSKLNPGKFLKELAKFISKVELLNITELLERDEIELDKINETLPLDCKKMLKIKTLLNILSDSYEYYLTNYSSSKIKRKLENSKIEKFANIFQYLYHLKNYNDNNEMYELLIEYTKFDFSAYDVISDEIKENLELDSKSQSLLLCMVNGATKIYANSDNQFFKSLFPHSRKSKNSVDSDKDNCYYLLKLLSKLSDICYYFHDDIEKISIMIHLITTLLKLKPIELKNKGMVDATNQFLRLFSVINFPLCSQDEENSFYFDSVTYQYISFFKQVQVEEMNLISQFDHILTELSVVIQSKLNDHSSTIIDSLNKLYILSYCPYTLNKTTKEFTKILPIYANSLYYQLDNNDRYISSDDAIDVSLSSTDEISSFLHISNHYINKSLLEIYQSKVTHSDDLLTINLDVINSINVIQRSLCLLLISESSNFSTDMKHQLGITYLNNVLCISAFKAEFGSLITQSALSELNDIQNLRSHIVKSVQQQLMKLFTIREYQFAELLGTDVQLEREEEEDVNFTTYSVKDIPESLDTENDEFVDSEENEEFVEERKSKELQKKKQRYEYLLCEIASKLILCCKLELIDDEKDRDMIVNRVKLNSKFLGELYNKVLVAVGVLLSYDELSTTSTGSTKSKSKVASKQQNLVDLMNANNKNIHGKKRKLMETETPETSESEEEVEDGDDDDDDDDDDVIEGGEDENDPIENSEEEDNEEEDANKKQRVEDVEFSSDIEEDNSSNAKRAGTSSEISSFASSFPFTQ